MGRAERDEMLAGYSHERAEMTAAKVRDAIDSLSRRHAKVSFFSVANESGVSRSTLYRNPELRRTVENAREVSCGLVAQEGALASEAADVRRQISELNARIEGLTSDLADARRVRENMPGIQYDVMDLGDFGDEGL